MMRFELREPSFLVLATLASGPRHGYALMQEIQHHLTADGGRDRPLRAGTLYAALDRLTAEGLVTETGQEVVDGRLRRYYDLTSEGERALAAEAGRLQRNAGLATRSLKARGVTA